MEIVGFVIYQLIGNLTPDEIKNSGFDVYYIDHTTGLWLQAAGGIPNNACECQPKGDPITDLFDDMAAEQKARISMHLIRRLIKPAVTAIKINF